MRTREMKTGRWYTDEEGRLYIVSNDKYGIAEIAGPDNDTLD